MSVALCRHLRTKRSTVPALRDPALATAAAAGEQFFCVRTLHAVGPDDGMVGPTACCWPRACCRTEGD